MSLQPPLGYRRQSEDAPTAAEQMWGAALDVLDLMPSVWRAAGELRLEL